MPAETRLYDLLGVGPAASAEELKKAYKKQALKHHPDRGGSTQLFQEIKAAYEVLSDGNARAVYDQYGEDGLRQASEQGEDPGSGNQANHAEAFGSLFRDLFGAGGLFSRPEDGFRGGRRGGSEAYESRARRLDDVTVSLTVTLEELFVGVSKQLDIERTVLCASCDGKGASEADAEWPCPDCNGQGMRVFIRRFGGGMLQQTRATCSACGGSGVRIPAHLLCRACCGEGTRRDTRRFEVQVPAGSRDGARFLFQNQGNCHPGYLPGSVVCILRVAQHPRFARDGENNLVTGASLSLSEALRGCPVRLEHLDQRTLLLRAPTGRVLRPGSLWRARREGMPVPGQKGARGDLLLRVDVVFPERLDAAIAGQLADDLRGLAGPRPSQRSWRRWLAGILGLSGPPAEDHAQNSVGAGPSPGMTECVIEEVEGHGSTAGRSKL